MIRVGLITSEPEMATWLCEDIGCEPEGDSQICTFSDRKLSFQIANAESNRGESKTCDVLVGIIRFVDLLSLQKLDHLLSESGAGKTNPCVILIYRNENESDFKMSCPYCGQKLWVRDADQDKRGRCPHCKKGFTLPEQEEHVSSALHLPASVHVHKIVRQDPGSLAGPLREMIQLSSVESSLLNLGSDQNMVSNQTMKVNVEDVTGG